MPLIRVECGAVLMSTGMGHREIPPYYFLIHTTTSMSSLYDSILEMDNDRLISAPNGNQLRLSDSMHSCGALRPMTEVMALRPKFTRIAVVGLSEQQGLQTSIQHLQSYRYMRGSSRYYFS